jgi:hypothetical protein
MGSPRRTSLVAGLLVIAATALATAAVATALTLRAAPQKITAAGVGGVKLGSTYRSLRAAHLVGPIGPGCELAGPNTRSARLRSPLKGGVDFTQTSPRKVANVAVTGGATARGVGIGASASRIRKAYPKAVVDHSTEPVFGITLYKVPSSGGGRLQFAVDAKTKKVTTIGIPFIAFCE